MKNLKTSFKSTSKDAKVETVYFQPFIADVYFSPSQHRLHYVPSAFKDFLTKVSNLTICSISLIPVTVENEEEVISRQQYKGFSQWIGTGSTREAVINDPFIIRGKEIGEFTMRAWQHYGEQVRRFHIFDSYGVQTTHKQQEYLLEQFTPDLLKQLTPELLERLKANKIKQARDNCKKFVSETMGVLNKISELIK